MLVPFGLLAATRRLLVGFRNISEKATCTGRVIDMHTIERLGE